MSRDKRGLRDVEAGGADRAPQLLLAADRLAPDGVDDGGLSAGFHGLASALEHR